MIVHDLLAIVDTYHLFPFYLVALPDWNLQLGVLPCSSYCRAHEMSKSFSSVDLGVAISNVLQSPTRDRDGFRCPFPSRSCSTGFFQAHATDTGLLQRERTCGPGKKIISRRQIVHVLEVRYNPCFLGCGPRRSYPAGGGLGSQKQLAEYLPLSQ